ncbi:HNH endonuclease family protein [Streptomyces sp. 8N114]|uniref:HNH endonuclease family protein n=1 Tax=Streptomyces sp. 8N114 TaxID=3457419 RepID=UPI003FD2F5B0
MSSRVVSVLAGVVTVVMVPLSVPGAPAAVADSKNDRALPPVPDKATDVKELAGRTTDNNAPNVDGYKREEFQNPGEGSWKVWPGDDKCTTRDKVMARDGQNVKKTNKKKPCEVTSGRWVSPYDGVTISRTDKADVDHIVPLKNAWQSGAKNWTRTKRVSFANELTHPQLLVVSKTSNTQKGYKVPEKWQPQQTYQCTYAKAWVRVKKEYDLTVTSDERKALEGMLNATGCT